MHSIDEFFDRLSWKSPIEVQKAAIEEARSISNLWIFIQPVYRQDIWENCAEILAARSDEELIPYMLSILEWLQTLAYYGALTILERIKRIEYSKMQVALEWNQFNAIRMGDEEWLKNLNDLEEELRRAE